MGVQVADVMLADIAVYSFKAMWLRVMLPDIISCLFLTMSLSVMLLDIISCLFFTMSLMVSCCCWMSWCWIHSNPLCVLMLDIIMFSVQSLSGMLQDVKSLSVMLLGIILLQDVESLCVMLPDILYSCCVVSSRLSCYGMSCR
jgi:hypothetical protein